MFRKIFFILNLFLIVSYFQYPKLFGQLTADELFAKGFEKYNSGVYDEGVRIFSQGINSFSCYRFYIGRAFCFFELSKYDEAKADLNKALLVDSTDTHFKWIKGNGHKLLGEIYSGMGDFGSELNNLLEARKFLEWDSELLNNIGFCKIKLNEVKSGIQDLNEAIRLNSHDFLAYNNRALGYIKLKNYDQALADLEFSKNLQLNNAYLYKNYAILYMHMGDVDQACLFLSRSQNVEGEFILNNASQIEVNTLILENCN